MRVLVACEESQRVCSAFRSLGHEAFSCDILPTSGDHPEWHFQCDVFEVLDSSWDMLIAFPPCTFLTKAGACRLRSEPGRVDKGFRAADFFLRLWHSPVKRIAIENPPPIKLFGLPRYSQIIHPYWFGHKETKDTCLWLKNLPCLTATDMVSPDLERYSHFSAYNGRVLYSSKWLSGSSAFERAKTFPGVASAMASQWGDLLRPGVQLTFSDI